MRNKALAVFSAFVLSATALHAQTPTTTPVDINTASRTEIAAAGWGEYADAIIAARPYKSMNDLVEKKVVPQKAYEKGYSQFTIGDGTSPLSEPNSASPTVTPPTATPARRSRPRRLAADRDAADGDPGRDAADNDHATADGDAGGHDATVAPGTTPAAPTK
jgi:hypothetical protein